MNIWITKRDNAYSVPRLNITNNSAMNKTVQSILSLTAFSLLLIAITFFFSGLGFGRLFGMYGVMEYSLLGALVVLDMLIIYKVCKLYFRHPKAIMLWFGMECCSVLLWLAFICIDQNLLAWQITNLLLQVVGLDGFAGDERGLNILAVLCGIIYPLIGKSSVRCPLKPSDSIPLCPNNPAH